MSSSTTTYIMALAATIKNFVPLRLDGRRRRDSPAALKINVLS